MLNRKIIIAVIVLATIVGAIFLLESRKAGGPSLSSESGENEIKIPASELNPEKEASSSTAVMSIENRAERVEEKAVKYERAKEISTPDGFINTESVKISDLIGKKVVLVDFWTYSCINCQRTLPYLNSWYEKYSDKGLAILGIHTPEFEFEKDYENVKRASEKFSVKYPVVLDNDYSTWTSYRNRYWPRKYLIDIDGFIVYDHIGEGAYEETEEKIVELLNERNETLGQEAVSVIDTPVSAETVNFFKVKTTETYLGYLRSQNIANLSSKECFGKPCSFIKPASVKLNTYALSGTWNMGEESVLLTQEQGEIIIRFSANKVNLVAGGAGSGQRAELFLDGVPLNANSAGSDVDSDSMVIFKEHDLYNLINLKGNYGEHELIIHFLEPGVQAFAFTFG